MVTKSEVRPSRTADAVRSVLDQGYAVVTLTEAERDLLAGALLAARVFFAADARAKRRHSSADFNYGYRPMGVEFSVTPDRPDVNECFTLWSDRLDLIPGSGDLLPLTDALAAWRDVVAVVVQDVLDGLAATFPGARAPGFRSASHLQVNSYLPAPAERSMLQDAHEDGHLVTAQHGTSPGLEVILTDGTALPVTTAPDQLLVFPGSALTALTDGAVLPTFHQVRNIGQAGRQSIMYFVNPELTEPLHPWGPGADSGRDLRDAVRHRPEAFGLPSVQDL
ncbi:MAG TPA: 2OG-Fe(II) oxygenase family protein [Actinomycetales bacterium]|jgi:isopenicillin N synthase-like dioxygenase